MVDTLGRVPLIEVNSGPALCRHGRVLEDLIPRYAASLLLTALSAPQHFLASRPSSPLLLPFRVIEEVFQKAVDVTFPPPEGATPPEALHGFELVAMPTPPSSTEASGRGAASPTPHPASVHGSAPVREAVFACTEGLERPVAKSKAEQAKKKAEQARLKAQQAQDSRMHSAVVDRLHRNVSPERQHERLRAAAAVEAARALIRRSTTHLLEQEAESRFSSAVSSRYLTLPDSVLHASGVERPPVDRSPVNF